MLQRPNNVVESWPASGLALPTMSHQSCKRLRSPFGNLRSKIVVDNIETDLDTVDVLSAKFTSVRRFSGRNLPKNDAKTEDVCHLSIFLALNNLWGHPLVGTDLSCHVISLESGPTKVCDLRSEAIIYQYIEANEMETTS